jgi:hypothetical protein
MQLNWLQSQGQSENIKHIKAEKFHHHQSCTKRKSFRQEEMIPDGSNKGTETTGNDSYTSA